MLFTLLLNSCKKDKSFPVEPEIAYLGFDKYGNDSADFKITFKDGDGDIGLSKSDTLPPYDTASRYNKNIFLTYEYKDSVGQYHVYIVPSTSDTLSFNYRIPVITPFGQNKSLDGEIHVRLFSPYSVHPVYRFKCVIYDRALHKSNEIASPDFTP